MRSQSVSYHGYRFPPDIISHAVWLYYRFCLSFRDAEDLLAQRGVTVTYETIRQWCQRFGPVYARQLRRRRGRMGDTWHLDEVFVTIQGRQQYLWRAVDEDGDVLDILVQSHRNRRAAVRFFRTLLKTQGRIPRRLITDQLRSYAAGTTACSESGRSSNGMRRRVRAERARANDLEAEQRGSYATPRSGAGSRRRRQRSAAATSPRAGCVSRLRICSTNSSMVAYPMRRISSAVNSRLAGSVDMGGGSQTGNARIVRSLGRSAGRCRRDLSGGSPSRPELTEIGGLSCTTGSAWSFPG